MKPFRRHVWIFGVLLLLGACGNPNASLDPREQEAETDIWGLLTQQALDYEYYESLRDLWQVSDVAVIGHFEEIREGRGIGGPKEHRDTIPTVFGELVVEEIVRGDLSPDSRRQIDLELYRPSLISVDDLDAAVPSERFLVLLQEAQDELRGVEIDDSGAEHDPGKSIYLLTTTKGLFVERERDLETPLDMTPGRFEASIKARTLEELAEEIRSF